MDEEEGIVFDFDFMKKICYDISEEESKKYDVSYNLLPLTNREYWSNYLKKQKGLNNISGLSMPLLFGGFHSSKTNDIVIFWDGHDIELFELVSICYHEIRHAIQVKFEPYSYNRFVNDLEDHLQFRHRYDYLIQHDKYSYEVGANLYGISQAKEYLKRKYPAIYEKELPKIKKLEEKYTYDYLLYDASDNFDRLVGELRSQYEAINRNISSDQEKKSFPISKISPVLEIFLNGDLTFKDLDKIIRDEKFAKLDKRIIAAVLSSKSFLEQISIDELSPGEVDVLNGALSYTNQIYENQTKTLDDMLKQKKISEMQYLKSIKSILDRCDARSKMRDEKIKRAVESAMGKAISFKRSDYVRKKHIKQVRRSLSATEEQISKKRGYLSITMCYFIGFILSVLTIIYLLVLKR